jgi:pantoate--beta-alanine ligase
VTLITEPAEWRRVLDAGRSSGRTVGVVPTMGALHAGHLSLIRLAGAQRDLVAVTDYVNPLQFAPSEDLAAYPRDLERDCALAEEVGAHVVFAPAPAQMWPPAGRPATTVSVGALGDRLEGAARPGHFAGVATVVTKLLSLAGACWAYFGEKDWQQLAVVRRLVADLSLPAAVVACPTVRNDDGLALSSRNAYLGAAERAVAPKLYWALLAGRRSVEDGEQDPEAVRAAMAAVIGREPSMILDYGEVADPEDLTTPARVGGEVRLLAAARLGRTRLIDNISAVSPHHRAPADGGH